MKWPETLTVVRHGESEYNALKGLKDADPKHQKFKLAYERRNENPAEAVALAREIHEEGTFVLPTGDHDTPLSQLGKEQAKETGIRLISLIKLPDVIFVSPYDRTYQTLAHMANGWPELTKVKVIEEERLREQEHGLALLYNDWRVFNLLHPDQEKLHDIQGPYWYRYPQGENVPDVRERIRSWIGAVTRDYSNQNALAVTHHLSILALRANLERLNAVQFRHLDENEKPINCGVTIYRGNQNQGQDGRLEQSFPILK